MNDQSNDAPVQKLPTGIGSFDVIAKGGLPERRTTLLSGTAGSGKTVFAMQFLAEGIRTAGEAGRSLPVSGSPPGHPPNNGSSRGGLRERGRAARLAVRRGAP